MCIIIRLTYSHSFTLGIFTYYKQLFSFFCLLCQVSYLISLLLRINIITETHRCSVMLSKSHNVLLLIIPVTHQFLRWFMQTLKSSVSNIHHCQMLLSFSKSIVHVNQKKNLDMWLWTFTFLYLKLQQWDMSFLSYSEGFLYFTIAFTSLESL